MTKQEFLSYIKKQVRILDGATGTLLQQGGMPTGVCPEKWTLENPSILQTIQSKYIESGSDIIYTCTFGANRYKLSEFALDDEVYDINKELAILTKKIVETSGKQCLVAGDIAPTGKLIYPLGDVTFSEVVEVYKEQAQGLIDGGVDLFVVETMINVQEARAAVIAIREISNLPIMTTVTFEKNGKTLTGTDPITALITLQSLGVDAFGVNCSSGPDSIINIIEQIKPYAKVPLIAKPNAGLPTLVNGKTVFSMDAIEFASYAPALVAAGANIIGGCCGTNPEYIKLLANATKNIPQSDINTNNGTGIICSATKILDINKASKTLIIGERINPTGKKLLQKSILDKNYEYILEIARQEVLDMADILDVNVGMPSIDESAVMEEVVQQLNIGVDVPLCIDSSSTLAIEKALRLYQGRAIINSISLEDRKLKEILPLAVFYGAMVIALPLTDKGLPNTFQERCDNINKLCDEVTAAGMNLDDVIIDGLVMTVSSSQKSTLETLDTIKWCKHTRNLKTVIGLSNVSFGLPMRGYINSSFMALSAYCGLTMAIANPSNEEIMNMRNATDVVIGIDSNALQYIDKYAGMSAVKQSKGKIEMTPSNSLKLELKNIANGSSNLEKAYAAIIAGDKTNIVDIINECLKNGELPKIIIENYLIPAITRVGDLFQQQIYFLPQLILSATAMETAFAFLKPFIEVTADDVKNKTTIVLATVKGDIHDIGKNIVALMLRNNGFEVIDLGNDVSCETIMDTINKFNPKIVGLSALMTTTMTQMPIVIDTIRKSNKECLVLVGGAVITKDYADQIGADGYASDAASSVILVKELLKK